MQGQPAVGRGLELGTPGGTQSRRFRPSGSTLDISPFESTSSLWSHPSTRSSGDGLSRRAKQKFASTLIWLKGIILTTSC